MAAYVNYKGETLEQYLWDMGWELKQISGNIHEITSKTEKYVIELYPKEERFKILSDIQIDILAS